MYLDHDPLNQAISNLLFHLKRDGKLILIEPHFSGHYFQTWFGLLTFFMKRVQRIRSIPKGDILGQGEIEQLFKHAGGKFYLNGACPSPPCFLDHSLSQGNFYPMEW